MGQPAEKLYTIPQYAALEADSSVKHEYVDGVVTAMAGATPVHCYVTAGIIAVMKAKLQGRPCQPFSSDLKIKTGDNYHYPDVSIVCRPVIRDDEIPDAVVNPGAIFEAISPGTEAYDRGAKFAQYRLIAELQDYILVSPTRVYAEHYSKTGMNAGTSNLWAQAVCCGCRASSPRCRWIASMKGWICWVMLSSGAPQRHHPRLG